jgi:hypothetical protein
MEVNWRILMAADLYRRALARAADILGGREQLAEYLRTDSQMLSAWSARTRPPEYVLQSIAQLLKRELLKNYKGHSKSFQSRALAANRRRKRSH